jgi:hypothetical protein
VVDCTTPATTNCGTTTGVTVCADIANATAALSCSAEPACACDQNKPCNQCVIPFGGAVATKQLCEPYRDNSFTVPGCGPSCTVEVIDRTDEPWHTQIAKNGGTLSKKLTGVTDSIEVQIDLPEADTVMAVPDQIVGAIYLAVIPAGGQPTLVSWAIRLEPAQSSCQIGAPAPMQCSILP